MILHETQVQEISGNPRMLRGSLDWVPNFYHRPCCFEGRVVLVLCKAVQSLQGRKDEGREGGGREGVVPCRRERHRSERHLVLGYADKP